MEPSSQEPKEAPAETPADAPEPIAPAPIRAQKSKKPLIITLVSLLVLTVAGCAIWFWWSGQSTDNASTSSDLPASNNQQQKAPEPNTVTYAYGTSFDSPRDLFWRFADGGERQNTPSKAFVGTAKVYGNQILVDTYYNEATKSASSILYSGDGGKTYKTIFTGKMPATANDMGDQITSMQFASDGKSVVFAVLPDNAKNTVKQIFFDKSDEVLDLMASDSRGIFITTYNVKNKQLVFSTGCYNCDGFTPDVQKSYDVATKTEKTLIDKPNGHLSIIPNKTGTRLLVVTPTVDTKKTSVDSFFGYYIGAPYVFSIFDLETGKMQDSIATVGTEANNAYVRGGFMADDTTPYYYAGNQLFMLDKKTPTLLYEAGQPIHEIFYASPTTVFASTGDNVNFTLNRFGIKSQETKQLLTGDDSTTRIFGITEN